MSDRLAAVAIACAQGGEGDARSPHETRPPRVLVVHNFYQQAGGEDSVVANEMALLRANGHEAQLYSVSNDEITSFADKTRVFLDIGYSRRSRDCFARELAEVRPDVVHVHNFFPLLTTSIYDACAEARVPVVQTLHNFRIMCAGVYLMRGGRICDKCVDGSPYQSVVHRCYRGSVPGTFAVARMIDVNRRRGTWRAKVDRFIVLTPSAKDLFVRAGLPADKIVVKPNFAPDPGAPGELARQGGLYVGRLGEEKGVREMIAAWRGIDAPLRVAGDGPLREELEATAPSNVTFLGRIDGARVRDEMLGAQMLIVFSRWLEGFPVVLAEAMAAGLPAIVSDIGSPRDIVRHGVTGLHVRSGDASALATAVNAALQDPALLARMGREARKEFDLRYSPPANYRELRGIYDSVCHEPGEAAPAEIAGVAWRPLRASVNTDGEREGPSCADEQAQLDRRGRAALAQIIPRQRVLIVHNYYQQAGGEDSVVANEKRLLEEHGHPTTLYSVHNDVIASFSEKARVFRDVAYSAATRDALARRIAAVRPDVVHVHNFFPLLTTSIYDACRDAGVPVVQTLHNFRIVCAGAFLTRNGGSCEKCLTGSPYWSVLHRCYRGSAIGSLAVARMIDQNSRHGTWASKVDRFVALTPSAKATFVRAGLPADRIAVKPNFAPDPGETSNERRHGALYVGRLSAEKGALPMIAAWRSVDYPLRIVGDGPLVAEMKAAAPDNVTFLGRLSSAKVADEMRRAAMLVAFSTCVEGFPVVIAEALACGLPIVVSDIGALRDIVKHGVTGLHARAGDPEALAAAVRSLTGDPDALARMSRAARVDYLANYNPEAAYRSLAGIYDDVCCVEKRQ
jgi:glycosyltransferase involved in cell wall biosynthesis